MIKIIRSEVTFEVPKPKEHEPKDVCPFCTIVQYFGLFLKRQTASEQLLPAHKAYLATIQKEWDNQLRTTKL